RHSIQCNAVRAGWIQPAHSRRALQAVLSRARQWQDLGAPVDIRDRSELAKRLGTDHFLGGWIDRRAGSIHPLNFTRGLLTAAQSAGAIIHGRSPVVSLERSGRFWLARTAQGSYVRGEHALIATNGYTDKLWPG